MNQLNIKDYTQILQYYNLPIPSNNKTIKNMNNARKPYFMMCIQLVISQKF